MELTIHESITGSQASDSRARAQELYEKIKNSGMTSDDARAFMKRLCIKTRSGVFFTKGFLRLTHAKDPNTPISFKTKNWLQINVQGDRLEESIKVLTALCEVGEMMPPVLKDFLQTCRDKKIQCAVISEYINGALCLDEFKKSDFIDEANMHIRKGKTLGQGGFGLVKECTLNGESCVCKNLVKKIKKENETDDTESLTPNPTSVSLDSEGHIVRKMEVNAAYLHPERQKGILSPLYYYVCMDGKYGYIPGGKDFTKWVKRKLEPSPSPDVAPPPPTIEIHALILPKAHGESLYAINKSFENCLSNQEVENLSHGLLNKLKLLAKNRLIHADIKPGNIFFDKKSQAVELIDTGNLVKIEKEESRIQKTLLDSSYGQSPSFQHPSRMMKANHQWQGGFENDLFAVGMTILTTQISSDHGSLLVNPLLLGKYRELIEGLKTSTDTTQKRRTYNQIIDIFEGYLKHKDLYADEYKQNNNFNLNIRLGLECIRVALDLTTDEAGNFLPWTDHADYIEKIEKLQNEDHARRKNQGSCLCE